MLLEGYSPGAIVPGVIGGISLLLALYALQVLPVNCTGVALIVLGVALMTAEIAMPSFGALGIGGVVALIAKQAEAERVRRAKVIHAEGEQQAAEKLVEVAKLLGADPCAIQLRYLQTLAKIAGDKSSTIVFPVPLDLIEPMLKRLKSD